METLPKFGGVFEKLKMVESRQESVVIATGELGSVQSEDYPRRFCGPCPAALFMPATSRPIRRPLLSGSAPVNQTAGRAVEGSHLRGCWQGGRTGRLGRSKVACLSV